MQRLRSPVGVSCWGGGGEGAKGALFYFVVITGFSFSISCHMQDASPDAARNSAMSAAVPRSSAAQQQPDVSAIHPHGGLLSASSAAGGSGQWGSMLDSAAIHPHGALLSTAAAAGGSGQWGSMLDAAAALNLAAMVSPPGSGGNNVQPEQTRRTTSNVIMTQQEMERAERARQISALEKQVIRPVLHCNAPV